MVMFTFFVFDQKCHFWENLVQNIKIVSLRLNLVASQSNSNMQNSKAVFTFFIFDRKRLFWANLIQNVKIVRLKANFGS